ncbi:uncharacterized protein LOC127265006 [Andrographis paniculata]|uniref:uncharacterized protein LOC127265006 n=1 Tax=Andrographis paniculata TaxID=175694 RepID=UPI0021E76B00|nr:uncharacterized protein LOC127265006 [Andrographis paniculata]
MGGRSKKSSNKSNRRGGSRGRGLFVEGGLLSDWAGYGSSPSRGNGNLRSASGNGENQGSKSDSGFVSKRNANKNRGNAIGYHYPQEDDATVNETENQGTNFDKSSPIVLINSGKTPIVAYMDEGPTKEFQNVKYLYDSTSFTLDESSHRGLGFYDDGETPLEGVGTSSKMEEKESDPLTVSSSEEGRMPEMKSGSNAETSQNVAALEENLGYLVIGGQKIYVHDTSSEEDDEGEDGDTDEDSSGSDEEDDSSATSEEDDSSCSGSDIDEEVAADYFNGIGGVRKIVNIDELVGRVPDVSDDDSDSSEDSDDEALPKMDSDACMASSSGYGLKKIGLERQSCRKDKKLTPVRYSQSYDLDDLMFVKDPRTVSGKKKHVTKVMQSYPSEIRRDKKGRALPGEKKKHRKEMIAIKRRERMIQRGVDLQKINLQLERIVLEGIDMESFPPMHQRDCSQVRRLASIYRLQSGCQGSGKKRFVTVMRTRHTCMPSSSDKIRLEKLIGAGEDDDFSVVDGKPVRTDKKKANGAESSGKKSSKNSVKEAKKKTKNRVGSYAAQPLTFISRGNMDAEITKSKSFDAKTEPVSDQVEYGKFEMHTTGFGSKMMARMGYVEGEGLGKDGQGMAEPIRVSIRPKSLGLGAELPEASSTPPAVQPRNKSVASSSKSSSGAKGKSAKNESPRFVSVEKHSKEFSRHGETVSRSPAPEIRGTRRQNLNSLKPHIM